VNLLLVNPWIYDFAAYDLWMKPLGLLYIAQIFKNSGFDVTLLDCMDRGHPAVLEYGAKARKGIHQEYGCGHFYSEEVQKPPVLASVPRHYRRFGMKPETFSGLLAGIPRPGAVLVSSGMTYWYKGAFEAIAIIKEAFPGTPVFLGGIYATLCNEHAKKYSGADFVFSGGDAFRFAEEFSKAAGHKAGNVPVSFSDYPAPYYEAYKSPEYAALRASAGCVYDCSYCAIKKLCPGFTRKPPEKVFKEIKGLVESRGIKNIAFYDDALLAGADGGIKPLFKKIMEEGVRCSFHTPNGLHAKFIDKELAGLMYRAGFVKPRVSLETSDEKLQHLTGGKVNNALFEKAVGHLMEAGYKAGDITAYVMAGLPGQTAESARATIGFLKGLKVNISLGEYSPIPGTREWGASGLDEAADPLLHNNTVYRSMRCGEWKTSQALKDEVKAHNKNIDGK